MTERVPVIAIDGPAASGKGTVARRVAEALGFAYLDSGALYRLVGLAALRAGVDWDDQPRLGALARALDARFDGERVWLGGEDVTDRIREEDCSDAASRVAALPEVRSGLLERQRAWRRPPGLVAEGRDMGSVVFPDAALKIYLTASASERALRRHKQLIGKGIEATIADLLQEIEARDRRDSQRASAPLRMDDAAQLIDTTALSVDEAVAAIVGRFLAAQSG